MSDLASNNNPSSKKNTSFIKSCVWLTLAILVIYPVFAIVAYQQHGTIGIWATAIAAILCWVGAFLALLMTVVFQGSSAGVLNGVLSGMAFRTGIPLVGGFVIQSQIEPLATAGVMVYVLVYYLFTLVVETLLSLKLVPTDQKPVGVTNSSHSNL